MEVRLFCLLVGRNRHIIIVSRGRLVSQSVVNPAVEMLITSDFRPVPRCQIPKNKTLTKYVKKLKTDDFLLNNY